MNLPVVHFETLADLLADADGATLRVALVHRTQGLNGAHRLPTRRHTFTVSVRAIVGGEIFSYTPLQRSLDVAAYDATQETRAKYARGWAGAQALRERLMTHLGAQGYTVRRGIIDLGGVEPVVGEAWEERGT
ncbi:MAG: hypothetical protein KJZ93_21795 [Caldilineaceae bacterium]|nr:hypothetical protein [Caldilineaceae bacterium]